MGLDVVELIIEVEKELEIRLPNEVVASLWEGRNDIQLRDLVDMVLEEAELQTPSLHGHVAQLVHRLIAAASGHFETPLNPDLWFKQDLDLY